MFPDKSYRRLLRVGGRGYECRCICVADHVATGGRAMNLQDLHGFGSVRMMSPYRRSGRVKDLNETFVARMGNDMHKTGGCENFSLIPFWTLKNY